jgi:hypothetical protein
VRDRLCSGLCSTEMPVVARAVILFRSCAIVSDEVFAVLYCSSCDGRCWTCGITLFSNAVLYQHTSTITYALYLF